MSGSFSGIFQSPDAVSDPAFTLIGAPWDAASTFRPGTRLGPQQIRTMASSLSPATERGEDLTSLGAVDAGDLALGTHVENAEATIQQTTTAIARAGSVPIVLGGDHAITVPAFAGVLGAHPGLELLVLDAHPDLYPDYEGDPFSHACVSHRIAHLQGMAGSRITQVGVRASNPGQRRQAEALGVETIGPWDLAGWHYDRPGPVYLSVDIDVLDPAHAPGCGNPVPGGLTSRQLLDLIQHLDCEIVAMDIVEVNPLLDVHGSTALAAVRVVTEALGQMARHQMSRHRTSSVRRPRESRA